MIKLLKKSKVRKTKCKVCKCTYSYESEDVRWYSGIYRSKVECPICGYENDV